MMISILDFAELAVMEASISTAIIAVGFASVAIVMTIVEGY